MKISVILPVYNCEKYIERCLDSLRRQSFGDFELIIADDGSTDKSGALCDGFALSDARARVLHLQNGGAAAARSRGLDEAKGGYITFVDADDCVPENYLQKLYETARNADIAVCDVLCLKGGGKSVRFSCKRRRLGRAEAIELLLSRREINSGPCGKLFSREVLSGLRFPEMRVYEDILFVLRAFDRAKSIAATDETEYIYDNTTGGAMAAYTEHPTTDVVTMASEVFAYLDRGRGAFGPAPEYVTLSHLMQQLQALRGVTEKNAEQRELVRAVLACFRENRKRIRRNPRFKPKERLVYLAASRGFWLKGGLKRIQD